MSALKLVVIALVGLALPGCSATLPAPAATPAASPSVLVRVVAANSVFQPTSLTAPPDATFAVEFENRDTVPHNVSIRAGLPGFSGEIFGGPATRTYTFAGLPAGAYPFLCDVHPEMTGTLQVTERP